MDFFESEAEAEALARSQLVAGVTAYVGKVARHGIQTDRPDDTHVAVLATLAPAQLARVRAQVYASGVVPSRKAVAQFLTKLLAFSIAKL